MEDILGLKINEKLATEILSEYVGSSGYMYYQATYYNIPWSVMHCSIAKTCFGRLVKRDGVLYNMLIKNDSVKLVPYQNSMYYQVDSNKSWLDLSFSLICHKRQIVDDEVKENIKFVFSTRGENNLPQKVDETILEINESRFPNWVNSNEAKDYRNPKILDIAKSLMPDLI